MTENPKALRRKVAVYVPEEPPLMSLFLTEALKSCGVRAKIISNEDSLKAAVRRRTCTEVIIGDLGGRWKEFIPFTRKYNVGIQLWSAYDDEIMIAKEMGVSVIRYGSGALQDVRDKYCSPQEKAA